MGQWTRGEGQKQSSSILKQTHRTFWKLCEWVWEQDQWAQGCLQPSKTKEVRKGSFYQKGTNWSVLRAGWHGHPGPGSICCKDCPAVTVSHITPKWKLKTEMGTKNTPITGAMFLHSVLRHYSCILLSNGYRTGFMSCALPLTLVLCLAQARPNNLLYHTRGSDMPRPNMGTITTWTTIQTGTCTDPHYHTTSKVLSAEDFLTPDTQKSPRKHNSQKFPGKHNSQKPPVKHNSQKS